MELLVLSAAFSSVFLLGINSKILRDDHIMAGAIISWFITVSQYFMTWAVFNAGLDPMQYILWAGIGGSAGITAAQYGYIAISKQLKGETNGSKDASRIAR